ncbi:MAG: hypothetical protein NTV63_00290 [Candidatus Woesearchaeota archaeon]|nr:hypothetical protein [Candidatus Woesearchaeota archaeon]
MVMYNKIVDEILTKIGITHLEYNSDVYKLPEDWEREKIEEGVMVLANNVLGRSRETTKSIDNLVETLKNLGGAESDEEAEEALESFSRTRLYLSRKYKGDSFRSWFFGGSISGVGEYITFEDVINVDKKHAYHILVHQYDLCPSY